jgi:hypothetical protein
MSQPTLRSCPVPTSRRLLPDATSTLLENLPSSFNGRTAASDTKTPPNTIYCPSPQAVLPFSRIDASRSFQHPSTDSSSAAHSSNASRRRYRLRYEIRLNPISILQRCHRTQEPKSTGNIAYIPSSPSHRRSAIQSRASHSSRVFTVTTARAIEQTRHHAFKIKCAGLDRGRRSNPQSRHTQRREPLQHVDR